MLPRTLAAMPYSKYLPAILTLEYPCCGVSYYALAAIGTGMIFLVMLIMGSVKTNNRYLLIIHADCEEAAKLIEETILFGI